MATYTWKVLSSTLGLAVPFLYPQATPAVGLMAKFDAFRCSVLEAKENQQMVIQLYDRAGMVSAMIENSLGERRSQDEAFDELILSFRSTMADVEGFYRKFWRQWWFQRLVQGNEVKSEFDGLWRRLDAHSADYRTLLIERQACRGPSERIVHPTLRAFWRSSLGNVLEAKWILFWEQLVHDFPEVRQFVSNDNVALLEAKADPRDPNFVGPREINNLFQPPTSSVRQIICTVLRRSSKKRIRVDPDNPTQNKAVQFFIGYWVRGFHKATQTVELVVAANGKIYGGGSDEIGEFTCSGECREGTREGTQVHFVKHYIGRHQVEYDGALKNTTIGGIWKKSLADHAKDLDFNGFACRSQTGEFQTGEFLLIQQTQAPVVNGRETEIVQVGILQHWTGHYDDQLGTSPSQVSAELVFTHTQKIYGSGEDSVGRFTWSGRYYQRGSSTLVSVCQQYVGKHVVHYIGAVESSFHPFRVGRRENVKVVMEGRWMHSNNLEAGTFCLQPEQT